MAFEVTYSGKPILLIANLCFDPFKIVGRDLKKRIYQPNIRQVWDSYAY